MTIEEIVRGIKSACEILGLTKHPVPVSVVAALLFGCIFYKILTYPSKPVPPSAIPPQSTGSATATGTGNVANTGNSSTINNGVPLSNDDQHRPEH